MAVAAIFCEFVCAAIGEAASVVDRMQQNRIFSYARLSGFVKGAQDCSGGSQFKSYLLFRVRSIGFADADVGAAIATRREQQFRPVIHSGYSQNQVIAFADIDDRIHIPRQQGDIPESHSAGFLDIGALSGLQYHILQYHVFHMHFG